ncbi:MAG TPA: hypothetical protein PLW86_14135, partial [Rhodocyclaceae bacterium]|nr:hypothetical protein [Rhodocyclaceae bacterium]
MPLPPAPLPPPPQQGSIDPFTIPADAKAVPIGTVLAGGDLSGGTVGGGSGIVGDASNNFSLLVDASGNPIAISSTGFNYSREAAPLIDQ